MTGVLKVAVAGFSASLMMGALSSGALAQASGKDTSASCQQTGNQLIQNLTFTTGQGTFSTLSGHVNSPDKVTASFTVPSACSVHASLVSYQAPGPSFDANTASQQTVSDGSQDDLLFGAGTHSMTVSVPGCYFQVDFVREAIIQKLGPAGSDNFYGSQGRLIAGANGGSKACGSTVTSSSCASATPQLSNVSYLVNGTKTVTDLRNQAASGETVKATFTVPSNCSMVLSLAAYRAPLPYFTRASAPQQVLVDSQTGTFTGGVHSMSVTLPACMYQVDFVHGTVLTTLGSTPGSDYEDRLISADNGGTTSCTSATSTPTPTPTPTSTPHPTKTPVSTPTPSAPTGAVKPVSTTSTPGAVLALSTSTPSTGANLAIGSAVILMLIGLAFLGISRIRPEEI